MRPLLPCLPALALLLATALVTAPARAAVDLRVESRPVSSPIEAYVTVTDANGLPVGGLSGSDFTVTLDGQPVTIPSAGFSLPPALNPDRNVSVVFAMDYSGSTTGTPRAVMEDAVVGFINSMHPGDFAAIVKFSGSATPPTVVQEFIMIDGATNSQALVIAATTPFPEGGTALYDAIDLALDHFTTPPVALPVGPKAVIAISDGDDTRSRVATLDSVIQKSSSLGIPLFTIAVSNIQEGQNVMNALAARTGGSYVSAPSDDAVTSAYTTLASRLDNAYLLSFQSSITDCSQHTLQVTVAGQPSPASVNFTRCDAPKPSQPSNGGGGGGSLGLGGVLTGLAALLVRRRRRSTQPG